MTSLWLRWLALFVSLSLTIRLVLSFGLDAVPWWVWPQGLWVDVQAAVMLGLVMTLGVVAGGWWRRAAIILIVFVLLLVSVAEIFYWREFEARLGRLIFHYLAYPVEVLVFLEEQFSLTLFALPFLLLVWLGWSVRGWVDRDVERWCAEVSSEEDYQKVRAECEDAWARGELIVNRGGQDG